MKQLTCPCCATVLERPAGDGECTISCPLCGETVRLSGAVSAARKTAARTSSATPAPRSPAAVKPLPLPPIPVAPRSQAAPAAPPRAAVQTAARTPMPAAPRAPLPAGPRSQARRAPAPVVQRGGSPWPWITVILLLLIIAGGVVWLVLRTSRPGSPTTEAGPAPAPAPTPAPSPAPTPVSDPVPETDPAPASPVAEPEVREVVSLDAHGDGKIVRHYCFPADIYSSLKRKLAGTDTNRLRRQFGFRQSWQEIQDFQTECKDTACDVVVRWSMRGLARTTEGDLWEAGLADEPGLSQVSGYQNVGVFTGKMETEFGPRAALTRTVRVAGGSSVKLLSAPPRIGFRLPATTSGDGTAADPQMAVQARPRLMACLGQVYAQPKLKRWWTARTVFKNTTGQALRDYSVRFRLSEYVPGWHTASCPVVVPGQTVVDAYFPLLNLTSLAQLRQAVPLQLEVEYQYRRADGREVRKAETRTVQMLTRNQVVFSSVPPAERLDAQDAVEDVPFILSALTTKDDKMIEEMAGRISRRVGGAAASDDGDEAMRFLKGAYDFMSAYIRYQTPSDDVFEGASSQTVKYGRDVLEARAGTCIDLAILYASVCRAVGLRPLLVVIKGHCFPAVVLPRPITLTLTDRAGNKQQKRVQVVAVETTMIGSASFDQAWLRATFKTLRENEEAGTILALADVAELQGSGVRSLPLPDASLSMIGINDDQLWAQRASSRDRIQERQPQGGTQGGQERANKNPATLAVGQWHATGHAPNGNSYDAKLVLNKDGNFKYVDVQYQLMRNGLSVPVANVVFTGTYKVGTAAITFTTDTGQEIVWQYRLLGNDRLLASPLHAAARGMRYDFLRQE